MDQKLFVNYSVEDFVTDETFLNYHFNSNKKDRLFWEDWFLQHAEKKVIAEEAIEIIQSLSLSISEEEFRNEYVKMKNTINNPSSSKDLQLKKLPVARFTKKRKMEYIVVLLVIIFSGWFWFVKVSSNRPEKFIEIANTTDYQKVITLSDSSVVTLSPHSYIQYPSTFKEKVRNVYLHGDAGFTVKRDVRHPFKVHSENIVATVLGTVFNVKKSGDSAIVVELLKGKLNVEIVNAKLQPYQSVLLAPNERAVYVRNDKHLYKNLIVPENYLNFKQSNFDEISAKIKAIYGITLINKSHKTNWSFTGEFKNKDVKEIIENMCLVKNLSFSVHGDTILIK